MAAEAAVATRAFRSRREGVSMAKDMRSAYSSAVGSCRGGRAGIRRDGGGRCGSGALAMVEQRDAEG